jgi:hypothetical protein
MAESSRRSSSDQAHQQRDEHEDRLRRIRVDRERLQRDDRKQEDDREPGEQDVERDFVRRLLALAPSTSAIMRSRNV